MAKDGSGKYKKKFDALKHVLNKSNKRTMIYVKKGVYYENVRVEKTRWNVMIIGDGMTSTIVSGSRNFGWNTNIFNSNIWYVTIFINFRFEYNVFPYNFLSFGIESI